MLFINSAILNYWLLRTWNAIYSVLVLCTTNFSLPFFVQRSRSPLLYISNHLFLSRTFSVLTKFERFAASCIVDISSFLLLSYLSFSFLSPKIRLSTFFSYISSMSLSTLFSIHFSLPHTTAGFNAVLYSPNLSLREVFWHFIILFNASAHLSLSPFLPLSLHSYFPLQLLVLLSIIFLYYILFQFICYTRFSKSRFIIQIKIFYKI